MNVSDEAQAAVVLLLLSQEKQQKSTTSSERKERIVDSFFLHRRESVLKMNIFQGLLGTFTGYIKAFQTEKPVIHTLHRKMLDVTKQLLGMFIKPECIPDRVSQLLKLDVEDRNLQKPDKDLAVGKYAYTELNKARVDKGCSHWVTNLYSSLRTSYVMAAKKILQMPLNNKVIRLASVLDPDLIGHSQVESSMKKLGEEIPTLFCKEENGRLAMEVSRYSVDLQVRELSNNYNPEESVDTGYWSKVFSLTEFNEIRYPVMKKLVSAMLTIFSGPLVESSFNIMDDIVEKDRTKMTVVNYETIAIIKTFLRKTGVTSTNLKVSKQMKRCCIKAYDNYQQYLKRQREETLRKQEEKLKSSVNLLKIEIAKRVAKLVKLKNRLLSRKNEQQKKRKNEFPDQRRWKRIKTVDY